MDHEKKIKMLQMIYAGALADSVLRLDREGILPKVTADKKQEQPTLMNFMAVWMMPLIFLISGESVFYAVSKTNAI